MSVSEWMDFGLVAAGVGLLAFLVYLVVARRQESARFIPNEDMSQEMVLGGFTEALAGPTALVPGSRDAEEIQPQLTRAGFYSRTSLVQYRAIRTLLIMASLVGAGLVCLVVPPNRIPMVAVVGLGLAVAGYSLPRVYIGWRARNRVRQIEAGLPVFADLMTLTLLAGQNLLNSLRRVAAEIRPAYPVVSDELGLVIRQAELNTLPHAFEQWAERCQVPDVRNLVMVLTQAQRMGTDITSALMEFANNLRATMRQRADAQAQRAGLWMIFPNIICLWIPAAVILVAPMAFEFKEKRAKAQEALRDSLGGRTLEGAINAGQGNAPKGNRQGFTDTKANNTLNAK